MSQTQYVLRRRTRTARQYREPLAEGIDLEMVEIPGGTFLMGSAEGKGDSDEHPQHSVTVPPFFLGKYPVTQAQWRAVATQLPQIERKLDPDPSKFKGDNRPVEKVSWFEAVEFCQRLAQNTGRPYRLPSEAEWEYACRAGTTTEYHFGETLTSEVARFDRSLGEGTTPVGSYGLANACGLYDMHGNVYEWCLDVWHENYTGAPIDGSAWLDNENRTEKRRLLRGGSWVYYPVDCRCANRVRSDPGDRYGNLGFRVCCSGARTS